MTKFQKILIGLIFAVISLNVLAILPLAFSSTLALRSALITAVKSPSLQNLAKNAFGFGTGSKVAIALKSSGIWAVATGGFSLLSEGLVIQVDSAPESSDSRYLRWQIATGTDWSGTVYDVKLQYDTLSDTYACMNYTNGLFVNQYGSDGDMMRAYSFDSVVYYLYCSFTVPSEPVVDFSNPIIKEVPLLSDSNGSYYLDPDGSRTPVYEATHQELEDGYAEVIGSTFDFVSSMWNSLINKPEQYDSLDYMSAVERANYYSDLPIPNPNILLEVDLLPARPDYDVLSVTVEKDFSKFAKIYHYDDLGNYTHTTFDNYLTENIIEDGVIVSTSESFDNRQTVVEQDQVGTTGIVSVLAPESTYTGTDALSNSSTTENTLVNNSSSNTNDGFLASLLGFSKENSKSNSTASHNSGVIAGRVGVLIDAFALEPAQPTSIEVQSPLTDFESTIPSVTDFQTQMTTPAQPDLFSSTYLASLFGNGTCINLSWNVNGTNEVLDLSNFCLFLNFFGVLLIVLSSKQSFEIIYEAIKG